MVDSIETIKHSLIQHGPASNRIYIMKLAPRDHKNILERLIRLARENDYSKIFGKIPTAVKGIFEKNGFIEEAVIPRFFNGKEDVSFMSKFLDSRRQRENQRDQIKKIIKMAAPKETDALNKPLNPKYTSTICQPRDIPEIIALYSHVFSSYPFPIFDPDYIRTTMTSHIRYYAVKEKKKIVALSSAETHPEDRNVEMTDFATRSDYAGNGFASHLLREMEKDMAREGMKTSYTIARALHPGINRVFGRQGYAFGGTLINNTHIQGSIESMNVWYKKL